MSGICSLLHPSPNLHLLSVCCALAMVIVALLLTGVWGGVGFIVSYYLKCEFRTEGCHVLSLFLDSPAHPGEVALVSWKNKIKTKLVCRHPLLNPVMHAWVWENQVHCDIYRLISSLQPPGGNEVGHVNSPICSHRN